MASTAAEGKKAEMEKRLFNLRLKLNAGRKANKKQVVAEHKRITEAGTSTGFASQKRKAVADDEGEEDEDHPKRKEAPGIDESEDKKHYLNDSISEASIKQKKQKKKQQNKASFGWDVFNQDALYNAYEKRLHKLPTASSSAADAATNDSEEDDMYKTTSEGLDRVADEITERQDTRKKFSRRRQHYEGKDVDYINDRNKHFNEKISRAFDKYTVEIRQNLERGTAL